MSLLMDALKKAEEAKRLANSSATDIPLPLDERGNQESLATAPHQVGAAQRTGPHGANTARNVFAAKQPPRPGRRKLWPLAAVGGLAIIAIAGYFWWQLQSIGNRSATTARTATPLLAVQPAPQAQAPPPTVNTVPPVPDTRLPVESRPALAPPAARPERAPRATAAPEDTQAPLRLARTTPKSHATLERAYAALLSGRSEDAQRDYEQVLRGDARNVDALLGLATLAAQQGRTDQAQAFYLRAFEADPSDPAARAGLLATRGRADAELTESRLKSALADQPGSAPLLFALGNLYARQARWPEAQQTYFLAYGAEPDNPDILFNLAVSLDHLRQPRLAAQYYGMALTAAQSRHAAFDPERIRTRMRELQP